MPGDRIKGGCEPYHYYFYGYIRNLLYCLEFVPEHTWENMIIADPSKVVVLLALMPSC
jgi:hypothetical protein